MAKILSSVRNLASVLAILACIGCRSDGQNMLSVVQPDRKDVTLTIETEVGPKGEVSIAGRSNLPQNTPLTALALRYLVPVDPIANEAQPTFAILYYQTTTVQSGQWEADLNLWQVADDGRYQEAWQTQAERLALKVEPRGTVHFIITLAPQQFLATINQGLSQDGLQIPATLVRTTTSGEALLWAEDALSLELPQGTTNPPADLAQHHNGGWGERYRLVPEPPLPYTLTPDDTRKTNAPSRPGEFLQ
jgi:hypothetical protein